MFGRVVTEDVIHPGTGGRLEVILESLGKKGDPLVSIPLTRCLLDVSETTFLQNNYQILIFLCLVQSDISQ